jgi:hypothetical protein
MVSAGDFDRAARQVRAVIALQPAADAEWLERAEALLARAEAGLGSAAAVGEAGRALQDGDYSLALVRAREAVPGLRAAGDASGAEVAEEIARRGALGVEAAAQLQAAETAPPWQAARARAQARQAAAAFARLGNASAAGRADDLVHRLDAGLAPAGWALLVAGTCLLAHNGWSRRRIGRTARARQMV